MDPATVLRAARERAGVTQAELARRARTSQATVSAYEAGRKQPSVQTLDRLLAAMGARLAGQRAPALVAPSAAQQARVARGLDDVLALAEALPTRHRATLAFPPLRRAA